MALTKPAGVLIQIIGGVLLIWGLGGLVYQGSHGYFIPLALGLVLLMWGRHPAHRYDGEDD